MSFTNLIDEARHSVPPFCNVCVNRQHGRCAPIANGTSNNGQLEMRTGYSANYADVGPDDSCIGKMSACGIKYECLPFAPRPGALIREFIRLLVANALPASHY